MHSRKLVALAMAFLVATLMLPLNAAAQEQHDPEITYVLAMQSENVVEVSFVAKDADNDALTCEYFVENAVTATRHEVQCSNNEIVQFAVPVVAQGSGIEGCFENTDCRIIIFVHDATGRSGQGTASVFAGTPSWVNDNNNNNQNQQSGGNSITIRDLGAETTGRLALEAHGLAASGIEYIDIYAGVNGNNPVKIKHCAEASKPQAFFCKHSDSNTYSEGTVITYYAKMKPVQGNEVKSDENTVTIQSSIAGEAGNFIQCEQACSRSAGTTVPIGYCAEDGVIPPEVQAQMNGLGAVRGPFKNSQATCPQGQYCWCVYIDYQRGYDQLSNGCGYDKFNLGRAPAVWDDPARLDPVPKKTASPAPYACDAATKATVVAEISQPKAESGTMLSVEGAVGRIADKCDGFEYTCRNQRVLQCDVDDGFFRTKLKYQDCPSGYQRIYAKGKKTMIKWGTILGMAALVCSLGMGIKGATNGNNAGGGSTPSGGPIVDSPTTPGATQEPPLAKGPEENIGRQIILNSIAAKAVGADDNKATGFIAWAAIALIACTAINTANNLYCRLPARNLPACYSVCAKDTQSEAAPTYESACRSAGTTYVVAADAALYSCTPSRAGVCGGFPNKEVNIKIRSGSGDIVQQANLFTDAQGAFEYTFRAPFTEGRYNAIVTVPGGI